MPIERDEFCAIMSAFPTGVAIVTTLDEHGVPRGLTTNAVASVSADPPILMVCVETTSRTLPALLHAKRFVVNFMRDDCAELCSRFASKTEDKFAAVAWTPGSGGLPILHEGAVAHAECTTGAELQVGDHVILTGLVEGGSPPGPDDVPIVWFRKGFSSAPSPVSARSDAA